jgi:hypothetical protein
MDRSGKEIECRIGDRKRTRRSGGISTRKPTQGLDGGKNGKYRGRGYGDYIRIDKSEKGF